MTFRTAASDMLLDWCRLIDEHGKRGDFFIRRLWDGKGSIDRSVSGETALKVLTQTAGGAREHTFARMDNRFQIAGYLGGFDPFGKAFTKFARTCASQNDAHDARFMEALKTGELA